MTSGGDKSRSWLTDRLKPEDEQPETPMDPTELGEELAEAQTPAQRDAARAVFRRLEQGAELEDLGKELNALLTVLKSPSDEARAERSGAPEPKRGPRK
jgi:hypothetical protein